MEPLKEGEVICPECTGTGRLTKITKEEKLIISQYPRCSKCLGFGKLDWIEMVVGKNSNKIQSGVYIQDFDMTTFKPTGPMRKL